MGHVPFYSEQTIDSFMMKKGEKVFLNTIYKLSFIKKKEMTRIKSEFEQFRLIFHFK